MEGADEALLRFFIETQLNLFVLPPPPPPPVQSIQFLLGAPTKVSLHKYAKCLTAANAHFLWAFMRMLAMKDRKWVVTPLSDTGDIYICSYIFYLTGEERTLVNCGISHMLMNVLCVKTLAPSFSYSSLQLTLIEIFSSWMLILHWRKTPIIIIIIMEYRGGACLHVSSEFVIVENIRLVRLRDSTLWSQNKQKSF